MTNDHFIGSADAAQRLGVDRSTVTRQVRAGDLVPAMVVPGYRGALLFDPDYIDEIAAERAS